MNLKPIIIIPGQPKSIFYEIFFESIKKKYKSPIILICDKNNYIINAKKFACKKRINLIKANLLNKRISHNKINIINVGLKNTKGKNIQSSYDKDYVFRCFDVAFKILKKKITYKFINGPINKKKYLDDKYLGITEFITSKFKKKTGMLIYNKELAVLPVTTHLPINALKKKITKRLIIEKLTILDKFYREKFKFKPKIAVTGLNPHCEGNKVFREDDKIILPAIDKAKNNKINVSGPFSADTVFLKQNRKKFDVIVGMYHDQVLTPIKTLFEYDAINITMGLPFLRISPDHGPNEKMINKNKSNPTSLIRALEFLDKNWLKQKKA